MDTEGVRKGAEGLHLLGEVYEEEINEYVKYLVSFTQKLVDETVPWSRRSTYREE
jgi:hypothetical protein